MADYLSQLNEQQRAAVTYLDGPQLVIAGAGSGKTRVLTYKIVHLLSNGYEPWRIMALTFTNKAAREMRERISELIGEETASKLWMGTFHSIFARILRLHADRLGYTPNYTIYDTADSKALVKTLIKDLGLDDKTYIVNKVLGTISMAKNALMSPADYARDRDLTEHDRLARRPRMAELYDAYCKRCHVSDAMDFDDLLYNTNILLRDNPDLLRHYQERFRYTLVDEYQDTNFAQHMIVSQLCAASQNLCVVGDDAQSIYSFRGANISNILHLRRFYPQLEIFKLERNYRSTQRIVNAAGSLIAHNSNQIPKTIFSREDAGERIDLVESYSDYEEGALVAAQISRIKMRTGDSFDDFAILYRTNAQSRVLEESLRRRNIPYRIYGGLAFYQRQEIKDATAYFRLAINPNDDEALRRVINKPARGIGLTTMATLAEAAIAGGISLWAVLADPKTHCPRLNAGTVRKLAGFRDLVASMAALASKPDTDADRLARYIIEQTRLLAQYISDSTPESISKQENLEELLTAVREFVQEGIESGADPDEISMAAFLAQISLQTDQESENTDGNDEPERVTMMTIHASKGLEFGNVMIVGVEEELLPSAMCADSPDAVEEERRLLYVAMTRAKRYCMLSYAKTRFRNGQTATCQPSRFISDIDPQYLHPLSGTKIPVSRYRASVAPSSKLHFTDRRNGNAPTRTPSRVVPPTASSAVPRASTVTASRDANAPTMDRHDSSDLRAGMHIEHERFGRGVIRSVDTSMTEHRITVSFGDFDTKTLLLKFARFRIINQ